MPIIVKIDVTKIDKTKLFKGAKGTYLELVLIDKPNQYGDDYMVVQGTTKEDRENGVKGAILGNARNTGQPKQQSSPPQRSASRPPSQDIEDEDIPF